MSLSIVAQEKRIYELIKKKEELEEKFTFVQEDNIQMEPSENIKMREEITEVHYYRFT